MREVPELESNVSPNDKGTVVKDNETGRQQTDNEWTTNGQQTDNRPSD